MDLRSGFHQILIFPEHRERTAFQTRWGTFQYRVMPFGLCNAPATNSAHNDLLVTGVSSVLDHVQSVTADDRVLTIVEETIVTFASVYRRMIFCVL